MSQWCVYQNAGRSWVATCTLAQVNGGQAIAGPYPSKADAEHVLAQLGGHSGGSSGLPWWLAAGETMAGNPPTRQLVQAGATADPLGLGGVAGFLARLGQAATWERALLVLLGAGLILVGLAKLTGAGQAAVTAGKIAGKAGLIA